MKNYCMIVDDNALVREATAMVVKHITGCPVRCCNDGQEALRVFEDEPDAFKCVITDFNMPGMTGLELGGRLRSLAPDVKLLLMTGNPAAVDESTMRDHGFHGMLLKPFTLPSLREAIRSFFRCLRMIFQLRRSASLSQADSPFLKNPVDSVARLLEKTGQAGVFSG